MIYKNKNDTKNFLQSSGVCSSALCPRNERDVGEREDGRKRIDFLSLKSVYGEPLRESDPDWANH